MCSRFSLTITGAPLAEMLRVPAAELPPAPRFNIAPSQRCATTVAEGSRRGVLAAAWGLAGGGRLHVNARCESVAETPRFRTLFAHPGGRCLVPADGYYEWRREGQIRQPYRFTAADERPFCFAGLIEGAAEASPTLVILTTRANASTRDVHHRMPLILPAGSWDDWLLGDAHGATATIAQTESPALVSRPVSLHVNDVRNDDSQCLREERAQPPLFDF